MSCTIWLRPGPTPLFTVQVYVPLSPLVTLVIVISPSINVLKWSSLVVMGILSGPVQVTLGTGLPFISVNAIKVTALPDNTSWDPPILVAVGTSVDKHRTYESVNDKSYFTYTVHLI